MFVFFTYLILISFAVRTLRQIFFQTYLWQLKEYRFDRMLAFIKTSEGRKIVFAPLSLIKWLLIFIIYVLSFYDLIIVFAFYLFWLIWILEFIKTLFDLKKSKLKFPQVTVKSATILFIIITVVFYPIYTTFWTWPLLFGPFLDKILAPLIALIALCVNLPFALYKNLIYLIASVKARRLKLNVIGITGSFGKTSTKEFLSQILETKYKIARPPGSFNTDTSISMYLLKNVKNKIDYFIAEMAAYRIGEIKKICKLLKPQIGIVTGIGNQHLELFGSIENLVSAKSELVESLPEGGIAVIKSGNIHLEKLIEKARAKNLHVIVVNPSDAKNVKAGKDFLNFDYKLNRKIIKFRARLSGVQHLDNLLLAITVADILGLSSAQIKSAVEKIKAPDKTMQVSKAKNNLTMIDNTFNVNFEGVKSGIEFLNKYKGRRILVLNPIIELSSQAPKIHQDIGKLAGSICDYVIVTNQNYFNDLQIGINTSSKKKTELDKASENLINILKAEIPSDSVVLFAGKESAKWMKYFK